MMYKSFLILIPKRFGEIILATPIFRNIKSNLPESIITVTIYDRYKSIIENNPYIDHIISLDEKRFVSEFLKSLFKERNNYDVTIDILSLPSTALITWYINSPIRIGLNKRVRKYFYNLHYNEQRLNNTPYMADFRLNSIRLMSMKVDSVKRDIFIDDISFEQAMKILSVSGVNEDEKYITITPISPTFYKLWPHRYYARLIERIYCHLKYKIILLCGPGEYWHLEQIGHMMGGKYDVARLEIDGIKKIAAIISKSSLHIGNDGGLNHIAQSLNIPTITIFGPTDYRIWNAPEEHCIAVSKEVNCRRRKCYLNCTNNLFCLRKITPEEVFEKVKFLLSKYAN